MELTYILVYSIRELQPKTNTSKQITQVLTKLQSGEADALGIQPVSAQSFISIIKKAMNEGSLLLL